MFRGTADLGRRAPVRIGRVRARGSGTSGGGCYCRESFAHLEDPTRMFVVALIRELGRDVRRGDFVLFRWNVVLEQDASVG